MHNWRMHFGEIIIIFGILLASMFVSLADSRMFFLVAMKFLCTFSVYNYNGPHGS